MVNRFLAVLRSPRFFYAVLALFAFQSLWIALTAVYPQAFDENFHFGIIQVYSHVWLPFFGSQPPGADAYGAVARDPSYLYHYLLSFPYRLLTLFTHDQAIQVIGLRILNIVLFGTGLVLFRRLLLRVGTSPALTNAALFMLIFIPIVPQLAGQVNYDNLLMPLTALACLLTCRVLDQIATDQPSPLSLGALLTLCFFTSLVKFEFLPIFAAIVLVVVVKVYRRYRGRFADLWHGSRRQWSARPLWHQALVIVLLGVGLGLFLQRDGSNLANYHTLTPRCDQVLSIQQCSAYPVWLHDYQSHQQVMTHTAPVRTNPVAYFFEWVYWLWYRLFFSITGPGQGFQNFPPLPLPTAAFALSALGGLLFLIRYWRKLFAKPYLDFLGTLALLYLLALLVESYLKYRQTAVLELMNGRYLLPIVLPVAALVGRAYSLAWRHRPRLRAGVVALVLLCFLEGGGLITFIARSNASWYWPNQAVISVNQTAQHTIRWFILEGPSTYGTHIWFFN